MITVIIPMYNSAETIERCLESVFHQTQLNYIKKIIVIDDGSKDNSYSIANNYLKQKSKDFEIDYKLLKKVNEGPSSARNLGIVNTETEWIAFLDSDDMWELDKIQKQVAIVLENPQIDFLGGNSSEKDLKILNKEIPYLYKANIKDLCIKTFPPTPTVLVKTNVIKEVGMFDENQKFGEDMNCFNKICINYNYYHVQEKLVLLRNDEFILGNGGLSSNFYSMHKGNQKNLKELLNKKNISLKFYVFISVFNLIKLLRRYIIRLSNNMKL